MSISLQELCRQKGVSLLSLAERSGVDLKRLQAILGGRWTPNATQRIKIAQALDTPSGDIAWQHSTPVEHFYGP
ncbi:MAG: helix-turn-helix transcriptional regulator [Planctomycetota bacterium]|nr:helix-turn-helix transcriptional regulator [Planctomycetota bacterium]